MPTFAILHHPGLQCNTWKTTCVHVCVCVCSAVVAAAKHRQLMMLVIRCLDLRWSAHELHSALHLRSCREPGGQEKMPTSAPRYSRSRWKHYSLCRKQPFSTVFPVFGLTWLNGHASSSERSYRGEYFFACILMYF